MEGSHTAAGSTGRRVRASIAVPVYNERARWMPDYWDAVASDHVRLIFVDDGSTDGTAEVLDEFAATRDAVVVRGVRNCGKAEAVRVGLIRALADGSDYVGYLDADGAFPSSEVLRLLALCPRLGPASDTGLPVSLWSSRVKLAGREIQRRAVRHYGSRVLLTILSLRLGLDIYDTQSGFKVFPATDELRACLAEPFETRWFVDLELYLRWGRLTGGEMPVWEEPVNGWRDVGDSSLRIGQLAVVARDIAKLLRSAEARGRAGGRAGEPVLSLVR